MSGGFAGGFAEGFSGTFGATMGAINDRKNREQQQQQFEQRQQLYERQFDEHKRQFDTRTDLSQQQEQRLREHQEWQRQAQEKQMELQERQFQVGISQKLEKAFDPRVPKPLRMTILTEASRAMGLTPESGIYKERLKLFQQLDNDTLSLVGTLLSSQPPEQRNAIAKGVMNGQIEISQVMDMAAQQQRSGQLDKIFGGQGGEGAGGQQGGAAGAAGGPPPSLGGGATGIPSLDAGLGQVDALIRMGDTALASQVMSRLKLFAENSPEVQGNKTALDVMRERELQIVRAEGQALGERQAPVEPRILRFLGEEPGSKVSAQQLAEKGIVIPTPEQIEELQIAEAGVKRLNTVGNNLLKLFENRPETLGLTGAMVRALESTAQQLSGVLKAAGLDNVDMNEPGLHQMAARVGQHLSSFQGVAIDAAQINSAVINLAYAAAASEGLTGRAITNRDIERMMEQLGRSQSPTQFAAVVRSFIARQNTGYTNKFEALTGKRKDLDTQVGNLDSLSDDDLRLLPDEVLQDLLQTLQRKEQ